MTGKYSMHTSGQAASQKSSSQEIVCRSLVFHTKRSLLFSQQYTHHIY